MYKLRNDRGEVTATIAVVIASLALVGLVVMTFTMNGRFNTIEALLEGPIGSVSPEVDGTAPTTVTVEPESTTTSTTDDDDEVNSGEDTKEDPRTPPLLEVERGLETWQDLVHKVEEYNADWWIDGMNIREPLTGFNWSDVLTWANSDIGDVDVRVIHAFGIAVDLSDEEIREIASVTSDNVENLTIIRHLEKNLMNTTSFGNGTYMETFKDHRDMVRVSLAPVKFVDGVPTALRSETGVFVDCGNLWWVAKKTPAKVTTTTSTLPPTTHTTHTTPTTTPPTTGPTVTTPPTTKPEIVPEIRNKLVCVEPKQSDKGTWKWKYDGKAFYLLTRTVIVPAPGLELDPPSGRTAYPTSEYGTRGIVIELSTSWLTRDGRVTETEPIEWMGKCGKKFHPPTTHTTVTTPTTGPTITTPPTTKPVEPPIVVTKGKCDESGDIAQYVFIVEVLRTAPDFTITHPPGVYPLSTQEYGTKGMTLDVSYSYRAPDGRIITVDVPATAPGPCGKTFEDPDDPDGGNVVPATTLP